MRMSRLLLFVVIAALGAAVASAQSLVTVYSHNFETPAGPEWSNRTRSLTPIGQRSFLGEFGGEPVWLELHNLPEHCRVTITYQLFVINSWEGSIGWNAGPDVWDLNVSSGPPNTCPLENLLHSTFANCSCDYQAFPDRFPNVHNPGLTDADEVNTLGYDEDSVYELGYSFYHDGPDLYFEFQGSPDLQDIEDESWGIDNVVVKMDTDQRYCCRGVRVLPVGYGAGASVPVHIAVTPNSSAQAYVVEETPPSGWAVEWTTNGGVFEAASGKIKWGPFFDAQERLLSYSVLAPLIASGNYGFSGLTSVDGESEPICGDYLLVPGGYHPADLDHDWRLEANELTAYAAAWRSGDPWSNDFHPITADLVTNAGMLWRSGESYTFDATLTPPWRPLGGYGTVGGTAHAVLQPIPDGVEVTITVTPGAGTRAWAVEDVFPAGWEVTEVSHGGQLADEASRVKWGPFFDDHAQSLTYVARPAPGTPVSRVSFTGIASFDGSAVAIAGVRLLHDAESLASAE
jgi:hypothetical protein